jgi:DMSO/TMAO reductase YedYZ molybdopterin-dependent catalytic subunit
LSKNTAIVAITVTALAIAVVSLAILNRGSVVAGKEAQANKTFCLSAGDATFTINMNDIASLSPRDIDAIYKTSGNPSAARKYQGVSLKAIVEMFGIDGAQYAKAVFSAADGYVSALPIAEAMDENSCFIVTSLAGKPLGTMEEGGDGPYMMIMANDRYSMRWCKYLLEVKLQ